MAEPLADGSKTLLKVATAWECVWVSGMIRLVKSLPRDELTHTCTEQAQECKKNRRGKEREKTTFNARLVRREDPRRSLRHGENDGLTRPAQHARVFHPPPFFAAQLIRDARRPYEALLQAFSQHFLVRLV